MNKDTGTGGVSHHAFASVPGGTEQKRAITEVHEKGLPLIAKVKGGTCRPHMVSFILLRSPFLLASSRDLAGSHLQIISDADVFVLPVQDLFQARVTP